MSFLSAPTSASAKSGKRTRGQTAIDFKSATTGVATKAMRNEISRQIAQVTDPTKRETFKKEMQGFLALFTRYLAEKAKGQKIDWEKIHPPAADQIVGYDTLPQVPEDREVMQGLLNKLVVLKLNGGLGTTMGMSGAPKSAIEVREGMTFLDLSVRQIQHLNEKYGVKVPLVLMNSFNTHDDTARIIEKYHGQVEIDTFKQSRYPRVGRESNLPVPRSFDSDKSQWYPPGHGDIFDALQNSTLLDKLIKQGKEYIFVSNVDNLGADVDLKILQHMIESKCEFLMELTDKTKADVKGGTIIDYEGQVRLLEIAQVPSEHVEDFKSVNKFKVFNTNNLWMKLPAIQRIMGGGDKEDEDVGAGEDEGRGQGMELDIIINNKIADDGQAVIQLETAVGAAIKHFKNAHGVNVPRSRFLPVKSCSDLLLITSDLYSLEHGKLVMNPNRMFGQTPVVKLGDNFKKIANFQKRFRTVPNILELDHLTVAGDVWFGRKVTLRGTVIIVANEGSRIDLPDGSILENKLVSGNVSIIDH